MPLLLSQPTLTPAIHFLTFPSTSYSQPHNLHFQSCRPQTSCILSPSSTPWLLPIIPFPPFLYKSPVNLLSSGLSPLILLPLMHNLQTPRLYSPFFIIFHYHQHHRQTQMVARSSIIPLPLLSSTPPRFHPRPPLLSPPLP